MKCVSLCNRLGHVETYAPAPAYEVGLTPSLKGYGETRAPHTA